MTLAVLQSHRDVIIRYLTEFDEVLKYANDLSGTIDLDTTLAQAEVLFLSFRGLIEDLDHDREIDASGTEGLRRRRGSQSSHKSTGTTGGEEVIKAKVVSKDLRDLLKHWTPEGDQEGQEDQAQSGPSQSSTPVAQTSRQGTTGRGIWLVDSVPSFM